MDNSLVNTLEKKVRNLMGQIKRGEITPAESKIGRPFNKIKTLDLPLYESMLAEYKIILEEHKSRTNA